MYYPTVSDREVFRGCKEHVAKAYEKADIKVKFAPLTYVRMTHHSLRDGFPISCTNIGEEDMKSFSDKFFLLEVLPVKNDFRLFYYSDKELKLKDFKNKKLADISRATTTNTKLKYAKDNLKVKNIEFLKGLNILKFIAIGRADYGIFDYVAAGPFIKTDKKFRSIPLPELSKKIRSYHLIPKAKKGLLEILDNNKTSREILRYKKL